MTHRIDVAHAALASGNSCVSDNFKERRTDEALSKERVIDSEPLLSGVVIVAATEFEIAECRLQMADCKFVVSGMGATNTAIATFRAFEIHRPWLMIQVGIAGAVDRDLELGEAVFVTEDFQADLGAWRDAKGRFEPFETPRIAVDNPTRLRSVAARSVNTACSTLVCQSAAQIESMEGAAFFQAASECAGAKFAQIRTISNYIDSPRNEWQIPLAISRLPDALREVLRSFGC